MIEDTRELRIAKPNVLAAECQTDAHNGTVDFDDLLKASLRWRPDPDHPWARSGAREPERCSTPSTLGHAGSMATIHRQQRTAGIAPLRGISDAFPSAGDQR